MRSALFLIFVVQCSCVLGQTDVSVHTSLMYDTVQVAEVFELRYTIEGAKVEEELYFESLIGLTQVSGPNTGFVYQSNNGVITQSYTYTFLLKADEEGVYLVPSIPVITDQGINHTDEVSVVVTTLTDLQKEARARKKSRDLFSFFSEPMEDPFLKELKDLDIQRDMSFDFFNGSSLDHHLKMWINEWEKQFDKVLPRDDSSRVKKTDKVKIYKM